MESPTEFVRYLFEKLPQYKNPVEARIAADGLFDTYFRLASPEYMLSRPLAPVRMHDAERSTQDTGLEARIRLYAKAGVGEHFQCSLRDYLMLPTHLLEMVTRIALEINQSAAAKSDKQRSEFEKFLRESQNGQSPPGPGTTGG